MADDQLVAERLHVLSSGGLAVSVISYLEAYQGALSDEYPAQAVRKLDNFVTGTLLLPVTSEIAQRCARIRHSLAKQGKSFRARSFDLLIASTALEHGLTLITGNIKDYTDIPRLKLHKETSVSS
jgi:predicted nucleic acid-binding protein